MTAAANEPKHIVIGRPVDAGHPKTDGKRDKTRPEIQQLLPQVCDGRIFRQRDVEYHQRHDNREYAVRQRLEAIDSTSKKRRLIVFHV